MTTTQPSLGHLVRDLTDGRISRRQFIERGAALGVGSALLGMFVRNAQTVGAAQDAGATPTAQPSAVGLEGKTRGQDGELKILFWQAVSHLNVHAAAGNKDSLASALVYEPLFNYLPDGSIWPHLAAEVPSQAAGTISADLTQVTIRLQPGILWSDGTPFTADDVVFTWQWITDPANNSSTLDAWGVIASAVAVDDTTLQVTFTQPQLAWFVPFTSLYNGAIYPRHYIEANGSEVLQGAPIGTGPYIVESFAPNDQVIYAANPNFRDPNRPTFSRVNLKGGGDAVTAAQSVIQTGDWDYAWYTAIEPDVIASIQDNGDHGVFRITPSTNLELLNLNFSDPRAEGPDGQLSWYEIPNPILSDPAVREAISLAIDRQLIVDRFHQPPTEVVGKDAVNGNGVPALNSPNTTWAYDPDRAGQILDDAGWVRDGDFREKGGVRLQLSHVTSVNSVRQKIQQVLEQNLGEVGIDLQLEQVDSAIFFDSSAGNEQNLRHFYADINQYSSNVDSPLPVNYLGNWYAGADRSNIAQAANGFSGRNTSRYVSAEYDALYEQLVSGTITDIAEANAIMLQLNDIIIRDHPVVPLVATGEKYAVHSSLIHGDPTTGPDNLDLAPLDGVLWNIANWNRSTPVDR